MPSAKDVVEKRWEQGLDHEPQSEHLVKLVDSLDPTGRLNLQMGGDGDLGEDLAYILDELIDRGWITLIIHRRADA